MNRQKQTASLSVLVPEPLAFAGDSIFVMDEAVATQMLVGGKEH